MNHFSVLPKLVFIPLSADQSRWFVICQPKYIIHNTSMHCFQLNAITSWIDGGLMYGVSKAWADNLRCFRDGKLAKSSKGNWPEENEIGLPMENKPPPTMHEILNGERLFSKFRND